jgi:hypothetical protein
LSKIDEGGMWWRSAIFGLAAVSAVSISTRSRAADGTHQSPTPFSHSLFGISGELSHFDFNAANGLGTAVGRIRPDDPFPLPIEFVRQSDDGFSFDATGGSGKIDVKAPVADSSTHVYVVLGGSFAPDVEQYLSTTESNENVFIVPIDGETPSGNITVRGIEARVSAKAQFARVFISPTIGTEVGPLSVNFGPLMERKELQLTSRAENVLFPSEFPTAFMDLDERVETWSMGPMIAGSLRSAIGSHSEVFIGAQTAILFASADLNAIQEAPFISVSPIEVSDSAEDWSMMARMASGIMVGSERFAATLYGSAEWRNDMFAIENPRLGPGDMIGDIQEPAHLEQADMFSLSVGFRGTVRFGRRGL